MTKTHIQECVDCHKQVSVMAGSVMHGSKLPLTVRFWAAYLMATHSNGNSALHVQTRLRLDSYKSAWLLYTKLRQAKVARKRSPMPGPVEVDKAAIACRTNDDLTAGGGGRSNQGKLLFAGAVEVGDVGPGRIHEVQIANFSARSLHAFLAANLATGATTRTDGWASDRGAPDVTHDPRVVGVLAAYIMVPWVHRVFSNLKTWALSACHACGPSICKGTSTSSCSGSTDAAFGMLPSAQSFAIGPITYKMLIAP